MNPDEFIFDEDTDVNNGNNFPPAEDAHKRTFLILASLLTGTLLLLSLGNLGLLLTGRTSEYARQVAAIETQNAVILATNAAVTRTVEVMEMERLATAEAGSLADASTPSSTGGGAEGRATIDTGLLGGVSPADATATASALTPVMATAVASATDMPPESPTDEPPAEATEAPISTVPVDVVLPTTETEATVTSIPAATSTPGLTPELTIVIIGVTYEPTVESAATPGLSDATAAPQVEATATSLTIIGDVPATPEPPAETGGYPPAAPKATEVAEGYPPAPPSDGVPPGNYPADNATETPVGGATPNPPATPTSTSPAPPATATDEPTATATELPVATEEPTATPSEEPSATPTELPTATEEPTATATGSAPPVEDPTAIPLPTEAVTPVASPTLAPPATATPAVTSEAPPATTGTPAPGPTATPAPPATLPQTGLEEWSFAIVGFALVLVIFGARRLRQA